MSTFLKIYGLILLVAIIVTLADRFIFKKKKNIAVGILSYAAQFYLGVAAIRTLTGSGYDFTSFTFYGKGLQGYLKVGILLFVIYAANCILSLILKEKFDSLVNLWTGYFAAVSSLYVVFIGQLRMRNLCFIGAIAIVLTFISLLVKINSQTVDKKQRYLLTGMMTTLFAVLYYIVGPLELFAYNSDDFLYGFADFYPLLLVGSLVTIVSVTIVISELLPEIAYKIYMVLICSYNVVGYVQSFILNGKMTELDGSEQLWDMGKLVTNAIIWLVLVGLIVLVAIKSKKWKTIFTGAAAYVIVIQLSSLVFIFLTTDVTSARTMQITEAGSFTMSSDENVAVILLDAYDTQFIDKVLEDNPDYLSPLKDFTYYNNMSSRYYYTDFSLPYLLTAPASDKLNVTDKSETESWYEGNAFLKRIAGYGYDINILTERKYVKNLEEGLVSNYTADGYCILDVEKTMSVFANCMRYKNMPFALKDKYRYEVFDLIDVLTETNIYRMGTDDVIDKLIRNNGISVTDDYKAFRFYHLYGAHAPYYLTENDEMDYNSCNPRAQFRGSLITVYDFIEALKEKGIYDNTTIIIMADHGLNPGQVDALTAAGEACDEDKSNPIFFIKKKNETRDALEINSKELTHDQYFDTLMQCIDPTLADEYYGSVWD